MEKKSERNTNKESEWKMRLYKTLTVVWAIKDCAAFCSSLIQLYNEKAVAEPVSQCKAKSYSPYC